MTPISTSFSWAPSPKVSNISQAIATS
jgi:hypothetical protein